MKEVVDTGMLSGLLKAITATMRDAFVAEVKSTVTVSKDAGEKLGKKLLAMRDTLKASKKWIAVVDETARLTGYSRITILRWVDGKYEPAPVKTQVKPKPEFKASNEIKSLVSRLATNNVNSKKSSADFVERILDKENIRQDQRGDEAFIAFMRDVVADLAQRRGLKGSVEIKVVS